MAKLAPQLAKAPALARLAPPPRSANCAATCPKARCCTQTTFLCAGVKPSACTPLSDHRMLRPRNDPQKRGAVVMGGRRERKEHWRRESNAPIRCQAQKGGCRVQAGFLFRDAEANSQSLLAAPTRAACPEWPANTTNSLQPPHAGVERHTTPRAAQKTSGARTPGAQGSCARRSRA